ncbi:signal peptidase I [Patescibacteria group bacterium]|nr:signal peptidase I [Patescibacteria group bacterium]
MVKKGFKSFFKGLGWTILILFIIFGIFLGYGHLNNRWYKLIWVQSDSMKPVFQHGDLICITKPHYEIKPGMIITFQIKNNIVTHRVVAVNEDGSLVTKGDTNNVNDDWGSYEIKKVAGLYQFKLPYLGWVDYAAGISRSWIGKTVLPVLANVFEEKVPNFFQKFLALIKINGTNAFFTNQDKLNVSLAAATEIATIEGLAQVETFIEEQTEEESLTIDKFVINNDDEKTSSQDVVLTISATGQEPENLQMRLANDSESWADENSGWGSYTETKDWQLSEGQGEKTVFLQIKDSEGNIVSASDVIIFEEETITEPTETTEPNETTQETNGESTLEDSSPPG